MLCSPKKALENFVTVVFEGKYRPRSGACDHLV